MSMTPQERELLLLRQKVDQLEREALERDRRLLRAEKQVVHAASWGLYAIGGGLLAFFGYLAFWRHNDFWDWVGIAFGVVATVIVLRESIREFDKK
jgi:hypothetical protein